MQVTAIVTARAGCKRVPGKNRELVPHTLRFVSNWRLFDDLVITTDDADLIDQCLTVPRGMKRIIVRRPPNLATGKGPEMHREAIRHALDEAGIHEGIGVLLQPTSPFREIEPIEQAVNMLRWCPRDVVGSVVSVDKHGEPNGNFWAFRVEPFTREKYLHEYFDPERMAPLEKKPMWYSIDAEPQIKIEQGTRCSFQVDTPEEMEMFRKLVS